MKELIIRTIFAIRVILNHKKESLYSFKWLYNYIKNGYYFPSFIKQDFRSEIHVKSTDTEKYVVYEGIKIAYPKSWNNNSIINNFNNIINEQTESGKNVNPHKYISESKLKPDWVVYDIGAAEGWQSKKWIKLVDKIIIFEPLPSFYNQLKKTFAEEIASGKIILLKCGVSNSRKEIEMENETIFFDSLENIIKEYNLPLPQYIKADIEGEEINFLNGALSVLKKETIKIMEITTYHRPNDYVKIPEFFNQFKGTGSFSEGVIIFNRNGLITSKWYQKIYHPVIRKCLYTFNFS